MKALSYLILVGTLILCVKSYGQASYVTGSLSSSKINYSPGVGNNRLLVVSATNEQNNTVVTVSSITWGGQSLTLARAQSGGTGANDLRTEIWYLNEAGINAATGLCNDFTVTWSGAITGSEGFTAVTLKDIDQATPVANVGSANANSTTVTSSNVAVGVNDIVFYTSSAQTVPNTHTAPSGYTELDDQVVGASTAIASAIKAITSAATEAPVATWSTSSQIVIAAAGFNGVAITAGTNYYSRNATSGGNWNDNNSWTTNSDGSGGPLAAGVWPRRFDNVTIRSGHTITVDATNDNKSCGKSPDALLRSNVGSFPISNTNMFYQTGDITINGTFAVTGIEIMLEGSTRVSSSGIINFSSSLVMVGYFLADAGSTISILDDIVLTGGSNTIINTTATSTDDLFIDHTDATLCGTGSNTLLNGAGSQITYTNSGSVNQICTSFTITCTGIGCSGFPVSGTGIAFGNSGPGGVSSTNGTNDLVLWLNANTITQTDNTNLTTWTDQSGYGNTATANVGSEPVFRTNQLNGNPVIRFTAANLDYLRVADAASLKPNTISMFVVGMYTASTSTWSPFVIKATDDNWTNGYAIVRNNTNPSLYSYVTQWNANFSSGALAASTYGLASTVYDKSTVEFFVNETSGGTDIFTSNITHSTNNLLIGIGPNGGLSVTRPLDGDIAEVIIFDRNVNTAERIIISNYLAAKYNLTLAAANDVYTMDNAGNGNFDFEVAGVGQASDGSNHKDAKGTGIIRMVVQNSSSLANNEYLIWGHNNLSLTSNLADVDNTIIKERLNRVWRVTEAGDVGNVSLSFDMNSIIGAPAAANLRLLIDRDGDGFFDNDVTPISGATLSGKVATFTDVNLLTGDRFTIGNTNLSTPLPITLISFDAQVEKGVVNLHWTTASELNNDYFTVQRSKDVKDWEEIHKKKGAGTTHQLTRYQFADYYPLIGESYYRLKQTDFDGKISYSDVIRVDLEPEKSLSIFPNPAAETFTVKAPFHFNESQIQLHDFNGRSLPLRFITPPAENQATIDSSELIPGLYIIQVTNGLVIKSSKIIIR